MKHKNTIHHLRLLAALLLSSAALLASCTRTDDDGPRRTSGDGNASGLCQLLPPTVVAAPFGAEAPATRSIATQADEQICSVSDDLVNTLAVDTNPQASTPQASADTPQTRATTPPIANGVYYRLVIFSGDLATAPVLVDQRLCKVGNTTNFYENDGTTVASAISLAPGITYHAICYSVNTTAAASLPELILNGSSYTFNIDNDMDFMVSDPFSFDPATTPTLGSFTLNHKCCRLIATVSAEDFDDNHITSPPTLKVKGSFAAAWSRSWNLIEKKVSGDSKGTTEITFPLTTTDGGATYTGTVYVAPVIIESTEAAQSLTVSYQFTVNGGAEGNKTVNVPNKQVVEYATDGTETAKQFSLLSGSDYSFIIKAMGVYKISDTHPTIGGVKWARTNLDRSFAFETQPWISGIWTGSNTPVGNPDYSDDLNDFWRWNTLNVDTSSDYPSQSFDTKNDPCRNATASGRWMMPSKDICESLLTKVLKNKWVKIGTEAPKRTSEGGYIAALGNRAPGSIFASDKSNVLFLPLAGTRYTNMLLSGGTSCFYWSSTLEASSMAYCLFISSTSSVMWQNAITTGFPIRCVESDDPAAPVTPPSTGDVTGGGWEDKPNIDIIAPVE